jgi:peptide/nickel transport system substrate-binding protein
MLQRSAAGAGALGALAIAGCDDGGAGSSTPRPQAGGVLRFGTSLRIAYGLDPHVEQGAGLAIFPKVYGYLLHIDPRDDAIVLDHAEGYEQPDATTLIVRLQPNIRFHDAASIGGARAVTASDVVASIERFRANPLVVDKTWHATVLDRAEAVDEATLRVTLKRPYVYSLHELGAIGAGAIIPRELADPATNIAKDAVGSGPFRADAIDVDGGTARIVRNGAYFRQQANVDAMEWRVFASDEAKLTAFDRREIDVIPNRDKNEAGGLRGSGEIDITSEPSLSYLSLGLRVDRPPFVDERVRRAIDMLLDRDELIRELAFGDGDVLGPVNPRIADGYWSLPRSEIAEARSASMTPEARAAEAMRLLAAAGAGELAFRLQVRDLPDLVDVAALVRNLLMRGGVRVEVEVLPELQWFVNFRGGQFDATLISQLPYESPDYPTRFFHSKGIAGAGNMFGFADAAIDALVERSWGEAERETRRETLLEAQRLMLSARPMLQLFTSTGYTSAWGYVRDRDRTRLGSMAQYYYLQSLAPDAPGRQV